MRAWRKCATRAEAVAFAEGVREGAEAAGAEAGVWVNGVRKNAHGEWIVEWENGLPDSTEEDI